jgi:hypothetical protein
MNGVNAKGKLMSEAADKLLEMLKAVTAEHPKDTARKRELNRRHDDLRQRQFIAAAEKIKYMTPGLYSLGETTYLLAETHQLFDLEFLRELGGPGMITSGVDPDMLWRLRRIA